MPAQHINITYNSIYAQSKYNFVYSVQFISHQTLSSSSDVDKNHKA
jgi:hypothetical protein